MGKDRGKGVQPPFCAIQKRYHASLDVIHSADGGDLALLS